MMIGVQHFPLTGCCLWIRNTITAPSPVWEHTGSEEGVRHLQEFNFYLIFTSAHTYLSVDILPILPQWAPGTCTGGFAVQAVSNLLLQLLV